MSSTIPPNFSPCTAIVYFTLLHIKGIFLRKTIARFETLIDMVIFILYLLCCLRNKCLHQSALTIILNLQYLQLNAFRNIKYCKHSHIKTHFQETCQVQIFKVLSQYSLMNVPTIFCRVWFYKFSQSGQAFVSLTSKIIIQEPPPYLGLSSSCLVDWQIHLLTS